MAYSTEASRWRALTIRDPNANGHFVYSVKTTAIYCRPICPARLARRANVGFYPTPAAAESDGFRACKRCKPNATFEDPQERAVEKACAIIDEAIKLSDGSAEPKALRLQDLAKRVGLTPRYFHKIFKEKMGVSPREYGRVKEGLTSTSTSTSLSPCTSLVTDESPENASAGAEGGDDWDVFDFNNYHTDFNQLVEFDTDASATLGFNLITGAATPLEMGFGNAVGVDILHQMWDAAYDSGNGIMDPSYGIDKLVATTADPALMPSTTDWHGLDKLFPNTSMLELDAAALFGNDGMQCLF